MSSYFRRQAGLFLLTGIVLILSIGAAAQSTNSSLSGTVKDQTGAVVPKANLTLTSTSTATEKVTVSSSDGLFRFSNLQAGAYNLKVAASGFTVYLQQGIVLALNDSATIDVTLSVGAETQTVEVSAAASPINHDDASHKGEISPDVLKDLPLNVSGSSRSAASFVVILPGVNT
jgi:hypothetical protein